MNITQETNDYFSTTDEGKSDFIQYMDKQFKGADWSKQEVWDNLKDKFKTTPERAIKKFSWSFRVDWGKIFRRK